MQTLVAINAGSDCSFAGATTCGLFRWGDKTAIRRVVVPEVAQGLDSPDAERALKAMKAFAARPKHADVEGLFVSGEVATLKLVEMIDGRKAYSSKKLRKVGNAWLVAP